LTDEGLEGGHGDVQGSWQGKRKVIRRKTAVLKGSIGKREGEKEKRQVGFGKKGIGALLLLGGGGENCSFLRGVEKKKGRGLSNEGYHLDWSGVLVIEEGGGSCLSRGRRGKTRNLRGAVLPVDKAGEKEKGL